MKDERRKKKEEEKEKMKDERKKKEQKEGRTEGRKEGWNRKSFISCFLFSPSSSVCSLMDVVSDSVVSVMKSKGEYVERKQRNKKKKDAKKKNKAAAKNTLTNGRSALNHTQVKIWLFNN